MATKHALLVIGGDPPRAEALVAVADIDLIVCADSGFDHAVALGLRPHVLIGDMDSVTDVRAAHAMGLRVIEADSDKDYTDTELALTHILGTEATVLTVLWGGGDRFDHVLGVVVALAAPELARFDRLTAHIGHDVVHVVHGGRSSRFDTEVDTTISLIPLAGSAHGVTTSGLRWALDTETLHATRARGVSNRALSTDVMVSVESGCVAVVVPNSGRTP